MPTAKKRFQIFNLHPKNIYLKKQKQKKNMVLEEKITKRTIDKSQLLFYHYNIHYFVVIPLQLRFERNNYHRDMTENC